MAVDREEGVADAACWTDANWFIDNNTGEEKVPYLPDSTGQTAALFCVEEFGVPPPPETGWVPRDKETSRSSGSKNTDASAKDKEPDWYRNVNTIEWIYQPKESMYYHLPTSSLWERRGVECMGDPTIKYTYCRVDSGALQALAKFAMSLDSAMLPMCFKAWVRFMRKKKDRHFGLPAPPASPGGTKKADENEKVPEAEQAPAPDSTEVLPLVENAEPTEGKAMRQSQLAPAVVIDASKAILAMKKQRTSLWVEDGDEIAEDKLVGNVLFEPRRSRIFGDAECEAAKASKELPPLRQESEGEERSASKEDSKAPLNQDSSAEDQPLKDGGRKGLFCLRCFRSSRTGAKRKGDAPIQTAPEATIPAPSATSGAGPDAQTPTAPSNEVQADSAVKPGSESQEAKDIPFVDAVDRHLRRLDAFLDLVTRNPQRLVDHIEKRRQGRTTSLGMFVA